MYSLDTPLTEHAVAFPVFTSVPCGQRVWSWNDLPRLSCSSAVTWNWTSYLSIMAIPYNYCCIILSSLWFPHLRYWQWYGIWPPTDQQSVYVLCSIDYRCMLHLINKPYKPFGPALGFDNHSAWKVVWQKGKLCVKEISIIHYWKEKELVNILMVAKRIIIRICHFSSGFQICFLILVITGFRQLVFCVIT